MLTSGVCPAAVGWEGPKLLLDNIQTVFRV